MKELQKEELLSLKIIMKKEDQAMGPDNGITIKISSYRKISYCGQDNQNRGRLFDRRLDQLLNRNNGNRLNNGNFNNQIGNWRNNGNFSRSPSGQGRDFSQGNSFRRPQPVQPRNSPFRRPDGNPNPNYFSYEQKFPQSNNQTPTNVVRFTTTDDCINELSELCP